ncbi:hypothetical protein [Desulfosoma sp.]
MKCPKCGFVGFDHVSTCAKCGKDLDAVRRELNLFDFAPSVPTFILDAVLALSQKAVSATTAAAAVASAAAGPGESLDLLGAIDLKVDLDEKPEEITLELLDEGEEAPEEPEPAVVAAPEVLTMDDLPAGERALREDTPLSAEAWPEALDLKIDGDAEATQEPGVFDLSDVEDEPEFAASLDEEAMTDEALERLRRELESADGILKDIEKDGVAFTEAEAEPARGEPQEDAFVLDLDALTEEETPKPAEVAGVEKEEPAVDGLVLELEDGFYIEPDEEEER